MKCVCWGELTGVHSDQHVSFWSCKKQKLRTSWSCVVLLTSFYWWWCRSVFGRARVKWWQVSRVESVVGGHAGLPKATMAQRVSGAKVWRDFRCRARRSHMSLFPRTCYMPASRRRRSLCLSRKHFSKASLLCTFLKVSDYACLFQKLQFECDKSSINTFINLFRWARRNNDHFYCCFGYQYYFKSRCC